MCTARGGGHSKQPHLALAQFSRVDRCNVDKQCSFVRHYQKDPTIPTEGFCNGHKWAVTGLAAAANNQCLSIDLAFT